MSGIQSQRRLLDTGHWIHRYKSSSFGFSTQYSVPTTLGLRSSLSSLAVIGSGGRRCPALSIPVNAQRQRRQVTGYWIGFFARNPLHLGSGSVLGLNTQPWVPGGRARARGWPINGSQAQGSLLPIVGPSSI